MVGRGTGHLGAKIAGMKKVVTVLAGLQMLAIAVQFFLAASGAFDSAPTEEAFKSHKALGFGVLILGIVLTIAAAVARMPGKTIGLAGLAAGLVVLQMAIAEAASGIGEGSTAGGIVFGLHGVNGVAIMVVTAQFMWRARQLASEPAELERTAS